MTLDQRYRSVLERIQKAEALSHRPQGSVVLIAVSKYQPLDAMEALYRLGQRDFGENYVQDLVEKAQEMERRGCSAVRWHFIGQLQSNKAKALVASVHAVHSVDSLKIAVQLDRRWKESGRPGKLPIFLQLNIDQEQSKIGAHPGSAHSIAVELNSLTSLELQGLMCIPDPQRAEGPRPAFARTKELSTSLGALTRGALSMGMTQDFEDAILEGATHVRVGTALFGARA